MHVAHGLGRGDQFAGAQSLLVLAGVGQEADADLGMKQLLQARRQGADQQPGRRDDHDPGELLALHLEQDDRAQDQGDGGQHLVGDAEQGPQAVDAAQGIDHAGVEEIAPQADRQGGGDDIGAPGLGLAHLRHGHAQQILDHEAADAGAGVDRGQDEQGLEQDGEVIPEGHHGLAADHARQDVGHAHGQGRGAARARQDRVLAHVAGQLLQLAGGDVEAPLGHGGGGRDRVIADDGDRAVHGEIDGRVQDCGGDQGHDGDETFAQHGAIADQRNLALVLQQLGRGARGDQGVEARHGAAGDGDEQEGEQGAGEDRAGAVDEGGDGRHLQVRTHDQYADGQGDDGPDLQEGRQIVARRQQQPDRNDRGDEAIDHHQDGQGRAGQGEGRAPERVGRHMAAADDGEDQQDDADDRDLANAAGPQIAGVQAHEDGDRDGGGDGEGSPRAFGQGLDHDQGQDGQDDDHDHQDADLGDDAGDIAHFGADHVAQRLAVAPGGHEQDHHVLHRAGQHRADQDPQHAGQIAHLGGQHRPDQRPRAGDGGEVVAEQDVPGRRHIVEAVVATDGGCRARGLQLHDLVGQEAAVEAIGDGVGADRRHHHPDRADALPLVQGDDAEGDGPQNGDDAEDDRGAEFAHENTPA